MKGQNEQSLAQLCDEIELACLGVYAAHEGFINPQLGGVRGECTIIEIFNVPQERMRETLEIALKLASERSVTFNLWPPEESAAYFQEDTKRLEDDRMPVFDEGFAVWEPILEFSDEEITTWEVVVESDSVRTIYPKAA